MIRNTFIGVTQVAVIVAVAAQAQPLPTNNVIEADGAGPAPVVQMDQDAHHCLNEALYWEGRNQDSQAMAAIGHVIMNRVESSNFPDSVCGVVQQGPMDGSPISINRCQFSYFCDGRSDAAPDDNILEIQAWDTANFVAELILHDESQDMTNGSTHYHANYVSPFWSQAYELVAVHGDHLFYRH